MKTAPLFVHHWSSSSSWRSKINLILQILMFGYLYVDVAVAASCNKRDLPEPPCVTVQERTGHGSKGRISRVHHLVHRSLSLSPFPPASSWFSLVQQDSILNILCRSKFYLPKGSVFVYSKNSIKFIYLLEETSGCISVRVRDRDGRFALCV